MRGGILPNVIWESYIPRLAQRPIRGDGWKRGRAVEKTFVLGLRPVAGVRRRFWRLYGTAGEFLCRFNIAAPRFIWLPYGLWGHFSEGRRERRGREIALWH